MSLLGVGSSRNAKANINIQKMPPNDVKTVSEEPLDSVSAIGNSIGRIIRGGIPLPK
jgi:hypothetical protein